MAFQRHVLERIRPRRNRIGTDLQCPSNSAASNVFRAFNKAYYSMDSEQRAPDRPNRISGRKPNTKWPARGMFWSAFDFSEIGLEPIYNDLRIVWLKMHSVLLKPTIRWILRRAPDRSNRISGVKPKAKWASRGMFGALSTSQKSDRN
jgi:hypothetical protein